MWTKVYKQDGFHFCSQKKIANQFPIINYDPKIPSVEILVFWSFRSREKQSVLGPPVYAARQHHTMCATSQLHYWSCSLTKFLEISTGVNSIQKILMYIVIIARYLLISLNLHLYVYDQLTNRFGFIIWLTDLLEIAAQQ